MRGAEGLLLVVRLDEGVQDSLCQVRVAETRSARDALRSALDQALCDESAPVREGAELAFFPPVTGG